MSTRESHPAPARHADVALAIVAGLLCVLPCIGLLVNAFAPAHVVPWDRKVDRKGWRWTWPPDADGRPETNWEARWRPPNTTVEEILLPPWARSQVQGRDQTIDRRNLPMRFAPQPASTLAGKPRRPGAKGTLKRFVRNRFGLRTALMTFGSWLKVDLLGVTASSRVIMGAEDWLFYHAGQAMLDDLRGIHPFPPEELAALVATFRRNRDYLAARGVAYVIVVCPSKARIYPELLPGWIRPADGTTRCDQLLAALASTDLDVVDLTPAVLAAKEAPWRERVAAILGEEPVEADFRVYQRTDTHWNDLGAFPAYRALAEHLRDRYFPRLRPLDLPDMRVARAEQAAPGDLSTFLYKKHDPAWMERLVQISPRDLPGMIEEGNIDPLVDTGTGKQHLPKALVFRDSFCQRLIPYLSQHFGLVRYRWTHRVRTVQPVHEAVLPWWLPLNERRAFAAFRREGLTGGLLVRRGEGSGWRWSTGPREFSMDLDIAWIQSRDDRPDIVIQQFGERTLVETPEAFGDPGPGATP